MKKHFLVLIFLSVFIGRAQYTPIPDINFEKALIGLDIDRGSPDGRVLTANISGVTSLNIASNNITNLSGIEDFKSLRDLECSRNKLTSLDITKNTALYNLNCWGNNLTTLDVSKNSSLAYLSCFQNQLTTLDLSKNSNLMNLYCSWNQLNSLDIKNGNNKILFGFNAFMNPTLKCIQVDNKSYSDAAWSTGKDATANYSEDCSKITVINAPAIMASGNQTYCPGTSLNIVETVSITSDPLDSNTDAVYIQISSGYVLGQDKLLLTGSYLNITSSWNPTEGKLTLKSTNGNKIPYADFESALKNVQYTNSSATPQGARTFSISLGTGQLSYLPRNKHFYEYVPNLGITWTNAKTVAQTRTYYGLQGYLATLTSSDEAQLAGAQAPGAGWIGGSDAEIEGTWKWVTGPEGLANNGKGTTFWIGNGNGSTTPPFNFAYWNSNNNEPNQSGDEDYAHITAPGVGIPGSWNDLSNTGAVSGNYQPKGYIVEYGGMIGDPLLQISASTAINIATILITNPNPICGAGSFSLQATSSNGIVNWYDSETEGHWLGTGTIFKTPTLNSTTTYFIDNGCTTTRYAVTAIVNPLPLIVSTLPSSRCDAGSVTLGATASDGIINWYDNLSGGSAIETGTSFTTPSLNSSATYYVDATANGCTSTTRTEVKATINNTPSIIFANGASRCDSGSLTLDAAASAGTINWYDAITGGNLVNTGTSFVTPILTATTSYYVEATTTFCTSPRILVTARINETPNINSVSSASRCDSGTLILSATASDGIINWYDNLSGGSAIETGTSFTTPSLNSSATYYVDATANGCTSTTRTKVKATINTTPSITANGSSRCDSGSLTLNATASAGTIYWYDDQSSDAPIGTGTSFATPLISSTTNYYVEGKDNGCTSPRLTVTATVIPITTTNEEIVLCQDKSTTLDASIAGMNYLWSPGGETTQKIVVSSTGDYTVTISSPMVVQCESKKFISVIEHPKPIINFVTVNSNSIIIEVSNPQSYYEFSINGIDFQPLNEFSAIPSGDYIAYVRDKNLCNLVQKSFTIFTISSFFTPNNDGFNDNWEIKELLKFPNSYAIIYDRYGKIINTLNALKISWDGTYNNVNLPSDDYWYQIKLDDFQPLIKGHFTLKR